MKTKNIVLHVLLLLVFVLAACGGTAPDAMEKPTEEAMMEKPTEEAMMPHNTPAPETMAEPTEAMPEEAMMESPTWYSVALTDVNTGETFTINDLKGKVVLVETMAVWCSKCFTQQTEVKALHASLGERDDFVNIGFDIDPNEDANLLKTFVGQNGFTWKYVVSPAEVSREIASLYGGQFLNPPSTPMLIIDRKGVAHPLPFGIKSVNELMNMLQPVLDDAM